VFGSIDRGIDIEGREHIKKSAIIGLSSMISTLVFISVGLVPTISTQLMTGMDALFNGVAMLCVFKFATRLYDVVFWPCICLSSHDTLKMASCFANSRLAGSTPQGLAAQKTQAMSWRDSEVHKMICT